MDNTIKHVNGQQQQKEAFGCLLLYDHTIECFRVLLYGLYPHKVCVKLKIICQGTTAYKANWRKLWGKRIKRKNTKADSNVEKHR